MSEADMTDAELEQALHCTQGLLDALSIKRDAVIVTREALLAIAVSRRWTATRIAALLDVSAGFVGRKAAAIKRAAAEETASTIDELRREVQALKAGRT